MIYIARVTPQYILDGTGDLCDRLNIRLTPVAVQGRTDVAHTRVEGSIFSLISFFTALASHYRLSLNDIRSKFA